MDPSSRVIVLTGATRGLGRALVDSFTAAGHIVIGCGRDAQRIGELRNAVGDPRRFSVVDVADDTAVSVWAQEALAAFGPPSLLINNAAVMHAPAPTWEIPREDYERGFAINVLGTANVLRHFVPAMIAKRSGVIVNLSSGWGRSTSPEVSVYCATKFAVEGLTRALSQELPSGMAAVPLNPGIIDTDMLRQCWSDDAGAYPPPKEWAKRAAPYILAISAKDNGKPLTVPG